MASSGATNKKPTHDMTLSDGIATVGLMLADIRGKNAPTAIRRLPFPRQSTKIATTNNKYSDLEPPYYAILQDNWSGGRGALNLEEDTSRFMDSYRAWTDQDKQITCGPQETYSNGHRNLNQVQPGDVTWFELPPAATTWIGHSFVPTANYTAPTCMAWVKKGTDANMICFEIYADDAGKPKLNPAALATVWVDVTSIPDTTSRLVQARFSQATNLTGGTTYWFVIRANSQWYVGVNPDAATGTKVSTDSGTTWVNATSELYFRVMDDVDANFQLFEYKRSIYAVDKQHGKYYLNGDRGAADDNSGNKSKLNDATKSWTADEWIGCTVLITKGPGASDEQPWRTIIDNDATSLLVEPNWVTTHTTETEYVILGSNKWTLKATLSGSPITDVAVADEFIYFAKGGNAIYRYNERNVAGVWTLSSATEAIAKAIKLRPINTPEGWELWGSLDNHAKNNACVWRAKIPKVWSDSADLFNLVTTLDDGKGVWDETAVNNVTVSQGDDGIEVALAAAYGTGNACSKEIPSTDITKGTKLGLLVKSSVATAAGDLKLKLDDTPFLGRNYLPNKVWHYDTEVMPNGVLVRRSLFNPPSAYYFDSAEAAGADQWRKISNIIDGEMTYGLGLDWLVADYIYVSSPERFTGIYFYLAAVLNSVASVLSAEYYNGHDWQALTITNDGTIASAGKTMGQSGYVYWTTPTNWNLGSMNAEAAYLAADRYNIRFKVSVNLSAGLTITRLLPIGIAESEAPAANQFLDMKNLYDSSTSSNDYSWLFFNKSSIYVRYSKKFNRIKFKITTGNNNTSTMSGYYWNGYGWVDASITDGTRVDTDPGAGVVWATLGQSGDVTFTMPTLWQAGCPSYLAEYLSETDYVIRLDITTDPTLIATPSLDLITLQKITIESDTFLDDSSVDTFRWREMNNAKDGDAATYDYLTITGDDYVYVMFSNKFNKVYWSISDVNDTEPHVMRAQYFNGHEWITLTINDTTIVSGGSLGADGVMSFTIPHDWQPFQIGTEIGYAVRFYPDDDLKPMIKINELYLQNDDAHALSVPALIANKWMYVEMAISPNANPNPDDSKIVSIGLEVAVDKGVQTVTIGRVELITSAMDYFKMGNERINSIEAYGDIRMNPWIFTESMVYEIQTQNDNAIVPLPLREITALRSETNGIAHTVSDVYLVFNMGEYVEKYYQHNLDDIGPNRDEGLPSDRQGTPTCMLSYPGKIFLSIDAGKLGESSILMRRDSGWHEMYRGPTYKYYGSPIRDMLVQVIPGMSTRLWVSQEYDILWLYLPTSTSNPKNDSLFRYTHESVVTTSWISVGFLDVQKLFKSVKIFSENLSGTNQFIKCEYQIEDGSLTSGWTAIVDVFDTSPFEEQLIKADYSVKARRIRFRFILVTTSNTESPIMKACVIEALLRFPVKYRYTCNVRLEDHPESNVGRKDMLTDVEDITTQLDTWADAPTVLTWRCNYSPYDNKKVVIEPSGMRPIDVDSENQLERHLGEITLMEV